MVPPPLPPPPLCTLPPGPGPPRFVCYCEGEGSGAGGRGGFNLYVTDAAELWSTCFTPDSLAALVGNGASGRPVAPSTPHGSAARLWDRRKARFGLSAAEDITPRFRAACEQQAVTLTFQDDRASLTLSGGPSPLDFDLSKVPGPEAASRLRALTLGLAERLCSLERQLAGPPTRASISAFPQLRRRRHPPAPARAPGRWALSTSCQTWILREVALDLGSRDGAQESLSSTPASRGRNPLVV
ncbi:protein PAXX isoform X2 [Sus scrofa]|uniref:protein PAXX isoform X2 n=1 Tax=Sus scrofa TaxID=9823 RepID=UPI000A2B6A9E|nr:protein PAXX isoform X2 [Sus scrofa]